MSEVRVRVHGHFLAFSDVSTQPSRDGTGLDWKHVPLELTAHPHVIHRPSTPFPVKYFQYFPVYSPHLASVVCGLIDLHPGGHATEPGSVVCQSERICNRISLAEILHLSQLTPEVLKS